jgi:hypothetical protein
LNGTTCDATTHTTLACDKAPMKDRLLFIEPPKPESCSKSWLHFLLQNNKPFIPFYQNSGTSTPMSQNFANIITSIIIGDRDKIQRKK